VSNSPSPRIVRLGTRGSALARAQADLVANLVGELVPDLEVRIVVIRTEGDIDKQSPLTVIGGRGVFTSALQLALLAGEIDAAVHSAKDLPSAESDGLRFAAFLAREDPRDVLITRHGCSLAELPASPVIGTSSRRRATQVRHARPDAEIVELRGNIDTRLKRALAGDLDGIVIAAAGISRMGWENQISEYLPLDHFVPAPGQGALAIEVRQHDEWGDLLVALLEAANTVPVIIERAFLRAIGAGCTTPIGAHVSVEEGGFRLRCMLASDDGSRAEWRTVLMQPESAEAAAAALSQELLATVQASPHGTNGAGESLQGHVVVVTRPVPDAAEMVRRIEAHGGTALLAPAIRIEPVPFDAMSVANGLRENRWDWVVFTSRNAVNSFFGGMQHYGLPIQTLANVKLAAVGPATAGALAGHGVDVDLVSAGRTGRDLGEELCERGVEGLKLLLPQGNLNRADLASILHEHGGVAETILVYATYSETTLPTAFWQRLDRNEIDAITFTSPSGVREFMRLLGVGPERLTGIVVGCIGETTTAEAHRLGLDWCVTTERPGIDELIASITAALHLQPRERREGVIA
jgi:hydroxymethylbilane synthase